MSYEEKVLDHGYVKHIESWGHGESGRNFYGDPDNECGIIEAARQFTQGSFRSWERDEKLLAYMYNNKHSTPFEFSGMVIEIQAPIFVFREWRRHRTQSYNEISARYAPLPDINYIPTLDRCKLVQDKNVDFSESDVENWLLELDGMYDELEQMYQRGLNFGMPKELARIILPVGRYSRMRASTNLRNWLAFLTLRMAPNAQWEIRQYANVVGRIIEREFPKTWRLFNDDFNRRP